MEPMRDGIFTDDDLHQGTESLVLGPAYFASRRIAERFMAAFEAEHFKTLIDKFAKDFSNELWTGVADHMLSDTESNLTGEMWRMVDRCVEGILSGEQWVLNKYALGERHNCERVRAAVALHIPRELQDRRILDLEAEVKGLKDSLRYYQQAR